MIVWNYFVPHVLGPSELDNFTDELRGVIPRSFEYLFFLINREVERVSCAVFTTVKAFRYQHIIIIFYKWRYSSLHSPASWRVSFANVHLLRYIMSRFMTSWTQPQPAFFSGRTSKKAYLLRGLWRNLSALPPKPTRYEMYIVTWGMLLYILIFKITFMPVWLNTSKLENIT